MREILFRAKRIDNGNWVEGYDVKTTLGKDIEPSDVIFVPWNINRSEQWGWIKVLPETLCQYTGLKDKNGNRIWENDIVQTPFRRFVVTYFDGVWGDRYGVAMRESIFGEGGVVIGNVFDNPELMEQEKETEV